MAGPANWSTTFSVGNQATAQTRWSGTATLTEDEEGGSIKRLSGSFSFRPGPRWQLSANPSYERLTDTQQYVTTMSGGRPEIYNSRYIFAYIDRSTVATEFRMSLTLKPDVNLDVYAEPFAASGRYYDYGELLEPGADRAAEVRDQRQHPGDQSRRLADGHPGRLDVQPQEPRLQHAVVPQQRRAPVGMAPRQHPVPGVAGRPDRQRGPGHVRQRG